MFIRVEGNGQAREDDMTARHRQWLTELTQTPTASGREGRVVEWVTRWVRQRRWATLTADRSGNLTLARRGRQTERPIYFTAHMDHPALVVSAVTQKNRLTAEMRGWVSDEFIVGSRVLLHHGGHRPQRGVCRALLAADSTTHEKRVEIEFPRSVRAERGDVLTWDVGPSKVRGDLLHAPACDDLAGVAAALAAFDRIHADSPAKGAPDVRVLLTRAEEVGFVGAIAACKQRTVPRGARLLCLENSKSFAESPIGGGSIVRVGDRTGTFDPDLTYRASRVAESLAQTDKHFKWQRKLMPGGTCEASAFLAYGYASTCLCLPLGNYHNMNEATRRIDAEYISLGDFDNLVKLLVAVGRTLDDPSRSPSLRTRLDDLFTKRRPVL